MKKNFNLKIFLMAFASFIASLATFPFGYQFSNFLHLQNHYTHLAMGCLFGGASSLANAILGIYSLSNISFKKNNKLGAIVTLSLLGAIPTGFFSYFGYSQILPFMLNTIVSIIVVIVNTGINFTAIVNLIKNIGRFSSKKYFFKKINWLRVSLCTIGGMLGLVISVTAYLATTNGIAHIASYYIASQKIANHIAFILALIAWLPLGALYLNANEIVAEKIYDFFVRFKNNIIHFRFYDVLLIIFVLLSGTAFSRMVYDFYDPHNRIPEIFKLPLIQSIAYSYLIPLALLSSAAVNYFALISIIKKSK